MQYSVTFIIVLLVFYSSGHNIVIAVVCCIDVVPIQFGFRSSLSGLILVLLFSDLPMEYNPSDHPRASTIFLSKSQTDGKNKPCRDC